MSIKNIVFDFGGVLLDLEPNDSYEAMQQVLEFDDIQTFLQDNKQLLDDLETGAIRYENFLWNVQRLAKTVPDGKEVINAWNAMLKGWKPEKLELLETLKTRYELYLLSNTNEIHLQWVKNDLLFHHNIDDFEDRYFNRAIFSHRVGMKKPDREIFQHLLDETGIDPAESLYIDDLIANVEMASSLGFQAILHPRNGSLDFLL